MSVPLLQNRVPPPDPGKPGVIHPVSFHSPDDRACQVSGGRFGKMCATALAWSKPIAGGQPEQRPPSPAAYPAKAPASDHRTGSSSAVGTKTPLKTLYNNQDSESAQTPPANPRILETCPWQNE